MRFRSRASLAFLLALAALPVLSACKVRLSLLELDGLNRSVQSQTVVLEDRFSLYSPFPPHETERFVALIQEELTAVAELFEVEIHTPIVGKLVAVDGLAPIVTFDHERNIHVRMPDSHPLQGLGGTAHDGSFTIFVAKLVETAGPDGKPVVIRFPEEEYRSVIRHEIAHLCLDLAGVRARLWLSEGVAEEVESMRLRRGRLVQRARPLNLELAMEIAGKRRPLQTVFDLKQDVGRIAKGLEPPDIDGRILAHSVVRYFMAGHPRMTFLEAVSALAATPESELVAMEEDFYRWLSGRRIAGRGHGGSRT